MLPIVRHGNQGPLLIALHWLGGSARSWTEVGEQLAARGCQFVALDLPGFGHAVDASDFSVGAMTDAVAVTIRELRSARGEPWLLVGHSMGGKLAAIVARASEDGGEGLEGLAGVVLVSPSPPGKEPMDEKKRVSMLDSLSRATFDTAENHKRAQKFVEDNVGKLPLLEAVMKRSVQDVLQMNRTAFKAWLASGSKEDWADRVGVLKVPALVMAGTEEEALGPEAQRAHTLPHFGFASLIPLVGGGHLGPLERPREVVEHVVEFMQGLGMELVLMHTVPGEKFAALVKSDYTSPQTRAVLQQRLVEPKAGYPAIFDGEELRILQRLVELVIPDAAFDLLDRLQESLSQRLHDGWRFDTLPEDAEAWRLGLRTLNVTAEHNFGVPFIALDEKRQSDLLQRAQDGELHRGVLDAVRLGRDRYMFSAQQMHDWFEDVRAELVKVYVADPRTLERIGFTGFADEKGFTQIRLGETEGFEN